MVTKQGLVPCLINRLNAASAAEKQAICTALACLTGGTPVSITEVTSGTVVPVAAPATPNAVYIRTATQPNEVYVWNGAAWRLIHDGVEQLAQMVLTPTNRSYTLTTKAPYAGRIDTTTTRASAGTGTVTFHIDSVPLGGATNAASAASNTQTHTTANTFADGARITYTVSGVASLADLEVAVTYVRLP
jgi:hypothetical protein